MKKKRLLLVLLFLLLLPAGILVISPYPRQLVFGPKIQGVPLCTWQEEFRRRHIPDSAQGESSFLDEFLGWFSVGSSPLDWATLSAAEQEVVLVSLLHDPVVKVREGVVTDLWKLESAGAMMALAELFADPDEAIRLQASNNLRTWHEQAKAALPKLHELLRQSEPDCRRLAVQAISSIPPQSREKRDLLLRMMEDPHPLVRGTAMSCLGYWYWRRNRHAAGALPALRKHLTDSDALCRVEAAAAIWNIAHMQDDIRPVLLCELKNPDAKVRVPAANVLGWLEPIQADTLAGLLELIQSERDAAVLVGAVYSLRKAGSKVVPLLISLLDHANDDVKESAVDALGEIGRDAKDAAPALLQRGLGLGGSRFKEPGALGRIKSKQVVPDLISLLTDDPDRLIEVIVTLGEIGPDAMEAVPSLLQIHDQSKGHVQLSAIFAVCQIDPKNPKLLPTLTTMLKSTDPVVRMFGADGLGTLGIDAKDAVPALIESLSETRSVYWSSWALGAIGPDARAAIPALLHCLERPDDARRTKTIEALGKIGHEPAQVIPAIMPLLTDKELRPHVVKTLGQFGPQAATAIPALVPLLDDDDLDLADAAAEALAKIDPARFGKRSGSAQEAPRAR